MKTVRSAFALTLAMILITACFPALALGEGIFETQDDEESVNTVNGLTMSLDKASVSRYSITFKLKIRNKTNRAFGFGEAYRLEMLENGRWTLMNGDAVWIMMGYYLAPGKSYTKSCAITDDTGKYVLGEARLKPGEYRIIKTLTDEDTGERFHIAARFEIEEDSYRYAMEPVNIRTGPGTKYAVIKELATGERVSFVGKSGKWLRVNSQSGVGYVFSKYLTKDRASVYLNHPVAALLGRGNIVRVKDVTNVPGGQSAGVYIDKRLFGDARPLGNKEALFDAEFVAEFTLKKRLAQYMGLRVATYGDADAAQSKLDQLLSAQYGPDEPMSFYRIGRDIVALRMPLTDESGADKAVLSQMSAFYRALLELDGK